MEEHCIYEKHPAHLSRDARSVFHMSRSVLSLMYSARRRRKREKEKGKKTRKRRKKKTERKEKEKKEKKRQAGRMFCCCWLVA